MKGKGQQPDVSAVGALLEVLRANGVKSYEGAADGSVRVELYPPAVVEARRPVYAPPRMEADAGPAPEGLPVEPTEAQSVEPVGPPGLFANMRSDDPLFRHIDVSKVNP